MKHMTKFAVVATLLMASSAMADQRGNETPKVRTVIESSSRCGQGSEAALCGTQSVTPRITLVSDKSSAPSPKKITRMPWLIGAFQ